MRTFETAKIITAAVILSAAVFLNFSPAYSYIWKSFGLGAKGIAMGGAVTAHIDDYSATFYNPAGLASRGKDFSFGIQYVDIDVHSNNPSPVPEGCVRDSSAYPVKDSTAIFGGVRFMLPLAAYLENRIGMGITFYQPLPHSVQIQIPVSYKPQFVLLNGTVQTMVLGTAMGVKIVEGLKVGIGASIYNDFGGSLSMPTGYRGIEGVDDVLLVIDNEAQPVIKALAGITVEGNLFSESLANWSMALTWRDSSFVPLRVPVVIMLGTVPLNMDISSDMMYSPMQAGIGLAYKNDNLTMAFDLVWNQWSKYRPPTLELDLLLELMGMDIDLENAVNADPGTKDTLSPRIGAQWRAFRNDSFDFLLRGGYAFEPSPMPEQKYETNYLDTDRHLLSAGIGFVLNKPPVIKAWGGKMDINLTVQYGIKMGREHRKVEQNTLFVDDHNPFTFIPITDDMGRPLADPAYPKLDSDSRSFLALISLGMSF